MRGRPRRVRCFRCTRGTTDGGYDLRRTEATQDRDGILYHEIHCMECGARGWTKHKDAARLAPLAAPDPQP